MARGTIQECAVCDILSVVDEYGPNLYEDEESQVGILLKREDKREKVVWKALHESINWVESNRCVGRWHNPLVVSLVQVLVNCRVV